MAFPELTLNVLVTGIVNIPACCVNVPETVKSPVVVTPEVLLIIKFLTVLFAKVLLAIVCATAPKLYVKYPTVPFDASILLPVPKVTGVARVRYIVELFKVSVLEAGTLMFAK